ncbi:MAG: phospholipase [Bacteroidota bacterium]
MATTILFIHGWSVTNIDTYGDLPLRLQAEAQKNNIDIKVEEIFLGRYISFHDEVSLQDISRAFEYAINEKLNVKKERYVCITHSTGAPVLRDWWQRYNTDRIPPVSHLIMLAPANFGSALAILGKGKLSRIKAWFDDVEPGQKVLDWLELGSMQAWELNKKWIMSDGAQISNNGVFPFVVTGQSIDRKFYDNLNSYTGELGSDGVVRTSSTSLNSTYIKVTQDITVDAAKKYALSSELKIEEYKESPSAPLRVVKGKSHSGDEMGIMKSVKKGTDDVKSAETVNAIFDCIKVKNNDDYNKLVEKFKTETDAVQKDELVEEVKGIFKTTRTFIHNRYSQVIFRVTDSEGHPVTDFDLLLTAGNNNPNHLPAGFAADRQRNSNNPEMITYYFNYDVLKNGSQETNFKDKITKLGLQINPRPLEGFVRFVPCQITANDELLDKVFKPNSTTLIDIVLHRVVSNEVFRFEATNPQKNAMDFRKTDWKNKNIIK